MVSALRASFSSAVDHPSTSRAPRPRAAAKRRGSVHLMLMGMPNPTTRVGRRGATAGACKLCCSSCPPVHEVPTMNVCTPATSPSEPRSWGTAPRPNPIAKLYSENPGSNTPSSLGRAPAGSSGPPSSDTQLSPTPPPGFYPLTGCGSYRSVSNASLIRCHSSLRCGPSSSTLIPSIPGAPRVTFHLLVGGSHVLPREAHAGRTEKTKGLCLVEEPLNRPPGQLVTNQGSATHQQEGSLASPIDRETPTSCFMASTRVKASGLRFDHPSTDRVKVFGKYLGRTVGPLR